MDFSDLWNFFVCGEVPNKEAIAEHFQNLCAKVGVECKEHLAGAKAATQTRDWVVAYSEWTSCGDIIRLSEGCEEEALGECLEAFLIYALGYSGDVTELKLQCKEFVISKSEFLLRELHSLFFTMARQKNVCDG